MTNSEDIQQDKERAISYHHGDLRNSLINAGLVILAKEGVNALSLRKAARRAGVSHAAPYRHFADKEALIAAIAEEGYQKLAQRMGQAAAQFPGEPHTQLLETGWAYIQFALENPNHLRVMFGSFSENCELDTGSSFDLLVNTIQAGQEAGTIAPGDPLQLAMTAWSVVHGLAILLIEDKVPPVTQKTIRAEQVARACIQTLYDGLRRN